MKKKRKANYINHILRKKFLIKHFTDVKTEGGGGRRRRRRNLPDELKEKEYSVN